ncbi:MAG: DUF4340 domain-containing protein [Gemmataceae bacterium]
MFGLTKPAGEVTVLVREKARPDDRDRSRERALTLRLGKPAWAGNRIFVQQAGWPRVDGLDDTVTALLDKPTLAYRGKQVFDFAAADVAGLEVRSSGRAALGAAVDPAVRAVPQLNVVLRRDGAGWALRSPVSTRADAAKVNDLLDALGKAKALTYLGEAGPSAPARGGEGHVHRPRETAADAVPGSPATASRATSPGSPAPTPSPCRPTCGTGSRSRR